MRDRASASEVLSTAIRTIPAPAPYDYREFKGRWPDGKLPVLRIHKTHPPTQTVPWGYAIYDDGARTVFTGGVKARLVIGSAKP